MDYCFLCHRILNGALVCPGCGSYAPDIAPPGHRPGEAARTGTTWESYPAPSSAAESYRDTGGATTEPIGSGTAQGAIPDASDAESVDNFGKTAPVTRGRAARRRQLARWKKNRRRAAAATAVALFGAGLTVEAVQSGSSPKGTPTAASSPPLQGTADTASVRPDAGVAPQSGHRAPETTAPRHNLSVAVPPAVTPPQTHNAVTAPATGTATSSTAAPAALQGTRAQYAGAPAPQTTTSSSDAGGTTTGTGTTTSSTPTTSQSPTPTTTTTTTSSPVHVCLLVLCID